MRPDWRRRIFWTLFGGYGAYYLCRVNLSIAQPEIAAQFGWSKAEVGAIASLFYVVYAVGKLLSGVAADRLGGRVLFATGILGSAVANLCFPLATTLLAMTAIWSVNAFFQSMGWAALVAIMARWYGSREQATAMGLLSANYQIGNAAAWGVMGLLAFSLPWTGLFWLPALAFALVGLASGALLRNDPREVGWPSPHELGAAGGTQEVAKPGAALREVLASPYFWAVCVISFALTFIRYTFITWAPTYLADRGSGISASAFQAALFPLVGSAGSALAGWYSDRFSGSRRGPVLATTCAALAATLAAFGLAAEASLFWSAVLLGLAGFTLYGPYSLLGGAIAIDLGSRHAAATTAGIIDGVGYVGAALAGSGMGWLIDEVGWGSSFLVLGCAAAFSAVLSLALWRVRPAGV